MKISSSVVIFASADALFRAPKGKLREFSESKIFKFRVKIKFLDFKNWPVILGTDANGNKINGRHPQRRLQSINKFLCNWFNQNVGGAKADRMCDRLTNQIEQYNVAFNRPTCAFFDPAVKNGGPNPDECKYMLQRYPLRPLESIFKAQESTIYFIYS